MKKKSILFAFAIKLNCLSVIKSIQQHKINTMITDVISSAFVFKVFIIIHLPYKVLYFYNQYSLLGLAIRYSKFFAMSYNCSCIS